VAGVIDQLLEVSWVYRTWQLPFERQKFAPVLRENDLSKVGSVLDVGCGPGTNASYFRSTPYLGVDINPKYVKTATRRFGDRFEVGDVTHGLPDTGAPYDFVLVNSLLHHLNDEEVESVLQRAISMLSEGGAVHILDLELPDAPRLARYLALHDRGSFPRRLDDWRALLGRNLSIGRFDRYILGAQWLPLWKVFYCRGGRAVPA
jgi:SAM-dependent methyltransferase